MTLNCLRCDTITTLVVTDEGGEEIDGANVQLGAKGLHTYICEGCLTDEEALLVARQSAAAWLDAAEEAIENLDWLATRLPNFHDLPDFKEQYARTRQMVIDARLALTALTKIEDDDGTASS